MYHSFLIHSFINVYSIGLCLYNKNLYIYTMGYYSAIKKNTFESVLMRWTKLEPIIQSEVSQKEKLLPSFFTSIRVFSNESAHNIKWYWSFSISPFHEYSGLISSRIDWFGLLAIQGTRKSLLQHHSSKASILWLSAFFMVSSPICT